MMHFIRGQLENYGKSRSSENFVITETEWSVMGGTAILVALAGYAVRKT